MDGAPMGLATFSASGLTDTAVDPQTVWLAARMKRVLDDEALLDTTMHALGTPSASGMCRAGSWGGRLRGRENYRCR